MITPRDLPQELSASDREQFSPAAGMAPAEPWKLTFVEAKKRYLNRFEAAYAQGVLDRHAGNVSRASEAADVDRKTFYRLLRKYRLERPAYRA